MSKDLSICQVYLLEVWGQRVKVTNQCGDPQNQPKAGPVAMVRESASHHVIFYLKIIVFCVKMVFFWSKNGSGLIWDDLQKNIKFSIFHQNLNIFFDTFPDHFESSRGPIELILSQLKALT